MIPVTLRAITVTPTRQRAGGAAVGGSVTAFPAAVAIAPAADLPFVVEPADGPSCSLAAVPEPDGARAAIPHRNAD